MSDRAVQFLNVPTFVRELPPSGQRGPTNPIPAGVMRNMRRHPEQWLHFADVAANRPSVVSGWRKRLRSIGADDIEIVTRKEGDLLHVYGRCNDIEMKSKTS